MVAVLKNGFVLPTHHELLTLIDRLATDYVVPKGGADHSEIALAESVGEEVEIARAMLDAQRLPLRGPITTVAD